jgi:hypothetical protein
VVERGIAVRHIRGDGRLQAEAELAAKEQHWLPLFGEPEELAWRSARPVRRKELAAPED